MTRSAHRRQGSSVVSPRRTDKNNGLNWLAETEWRATPRFCTKQCDFTAINVTNTADSSRSRARKNGAFDKPKLWIAEFGLPAPACTHATLD
jgi:hypothetical protein